MIGLALQAGGVVAAAAVVLYMLVIGIASVVGALHSDAARRMDGQRVLRLLLGPLQRRRR
jgi:hypothetical protein